MSDTCKRDGWKKVGSSGLYNDEDSFLYLVIILGRSGDRSIFDPVLYMSEV